MSVTTLFDCLSRLMRCEQLYLEGNTIFAPGEHHLFGWEMPEFTPEDRFIPGGLTLPTFTMRKNGWLCPRWPHDWLGQSFLTTFAKVAGPPSLGSRCSIFHPSSRDTPLYWYHRPKVDHPAYEGNAESHIFRLHDRCVVLLFNPSHSPPSAIHYILGSEDKYVNPAVGVPSGPRDGTYLGLHRILRTSTAVVPDENAHIPHSLISFDAAMGRFCFCTVVEGRQDLSVYDLLE